MKRVKNANGTFAQVYNGKPRNGTLTISISDELKDEFKAYCKANGDSVSNAVCELIMSQLRDGKTQVTAGELYTIIEDNPIALTDLEITEIRSSRIVKRPKAAQQFKKSFLNSELFKIEVI